MGELNSISKEEYERLLAELTLMDDIFMNIVFSACPHLVQTILRIILDKPGLIVKSVRVQHQLKNLVGHSITYDIDAVDYDDTECDIEFQNLKKGANLSAHACTAVLWMPISL